MIKKSIDTRVTYLQLLKWRLVWDRGCFNGAYKYGANNYAIAYDKAEWKAVPFFQKVAYLFN